MKTKIITISAIALIIITVATAALMMLRPQTATAGASTPRVYTVLVHDQSIPTEISVSHAWEADHEYARTNATMARTPSKGDAINLSVSAYVITGLVMPTGITGLTTPSIKGMSVSGTWSGSPIVITLANRTTLTLIPTGEGVALTVKEA